MPKPAPRWSPRVTVAAVIEDGGRFLLVEEETPDGLRLNNPAGHLEPGETPEQGVMREALEETARSFEPEALLGVYLARSQSLAGGEGVTYLRLAFRGRTGTPIEGRGLDRGIVRTLWLTPDEIRAESARHRSPLVMRCIDDHLAGCAYPLALLRVDESLVRHDGTRRRRRRHRPREVEHGDNARPMQDMPESITAEPMPPPQAPPAEPAQATPAAAEPTLAQTAAALAERFPALFTPGAPRPVKLRIHADIQQRAPGVFTRRQLAIFLHRHTTSTAYLRALAATAERFDLDGAAAGEVSAEHREAAAAEVERRRQIVEQRRAAARAARGDAGQGPRPDAARPNERRPRGRDDAARHDRRTQAQEGPRPPRPPRERAPHPPHRPRPPQAPREHAAAPHEAAPPAPERLPDDPARRERALLLRAWESSPLTPANFCALKGLELADFQARIELAQRERAERQQAARRG